MPHNKPHEHGVVLRTPSDPRELEGAWFHAATPEDAREMYHCFAEGDHGTAVFDLVIEGQIVESAESI